ncbi:hypothetical protein CEXT_342141 [Caerostris extrusa]|uniref:Secreted protein n=1 Tax=Caerostris extrusa TaxID=172846 RepID=A0AAV4TIT2_CAEEX|nr:hypothetical protein CEXT_342141 [Caerostris extrusa]
MKAAIMRAHVLNTLQVFVSNSATMKPNFCAIVVQPHHIVDEHSIVKAYNSLPYVARFACSVRMVALLEWPALLPTNVWCF